MLKLRGLKCYIFPYIPLYVKEGDKREVFYVEVKINFRILLEREQPHADRYAL